jgi:hypothetical protein
MMVMVEIVLHLNLDFLVYDDVFQLFVRPREKKHSECQISSGIFLHTTKSLSRRIPLLKQLAKRHAEQRRRDARVTSQLP